MRDLFDVLRHPLVISAFVLSILIVVGAYFVSHWYYGDVEPVDIPDISAPPPATNPSSSEVDLSGLQWEPSQTESPPTGSSTEGESVDDSLAELSAEELPLLTAEVVEELPPRESIHGLGPYPEIPSDYPHQNIWEDLEKYYETGHATIEHELMHRVVIKLWNQGTKVGGSFLSMKNGQVYPLYDNTVYVRYLKDEKADGSIERYVSSYTSHSSLASYEEAVREGTQPSWLKVVHYEDGGVEPYSFLGLD